MIWGSVSSTLWRNDLEFSQLNSMTQWLVSSTIWRHDLWICQLNSYDAMICKSQLYDAMTWESVSVTLCHNCLGICQLIIERIWLGNLPAQFSDAMTWKSVRWNIWRNDLGICQFNSCDAMTWESVSSTLVTQWPGNLSAQLYDAITFESVSSRMLSPGRTTLSTATATMITHSTPTFRKSKNLLTWTSSSIGSTLHFKTFKISCRARLFYNMRPLLILQELVAWRYASVIVSIWNWILQR